MRPERIDRGIPEWTAAEVAGAKQSMPIGGEEGCRLQARDSASQRLAGLAQQRTGSTTQQEAPRAPIGIDLRPQAREGLWHVLHFVQHGQPVALQGQEQLGPGQHRAIAVALQVQHDGAFVAGGDRLGQRGLADLARPEQRHGGVLPQSSAMTFCTWRSSIIAF